ncbi:MAG: hypothetical protein LBD67_02795 [Candidatus Accumulibacter sp.]|nr:hypothetical protein [Accumulibacter sp.]
MPCVWKALAGASQWKSWENEKGRKANLLPAEGPRFSEMDDDLKHFTVRREMLFSKGVCAAPGRRISLRASSMVRHWTKKWNSSM